jgi:predicted  nucleic acid-binding Zn-ribbon protein
VSKASTLYALQQIDSELDARHAQLADVEARIGESEALAALATALEETRSQMAGVQRRVRDAEAEVQQHESHVTEIEKKLYGGRVRAPRELEDLQKDVEAVQRQKRVAEDRELEAMVDLETLQTQAADQQAELTRLTREWEEEQAALRDRRTALQTDIARLSEQSEAQARQVEAGALAQYRAMREKRPLAVVAVIQGQCQGCRIGQPMTLLQRARNPELLVNCASCGRILYVE